MKKTTLAIGVVAILGIVYVGTSWYTGNIIANNLDNELNKITEAINNHDQENNIAITYHDYQKNLFSTKLHLTVTQSRKSSANTKEQPTKLFDDELTIHHGPFPIVALSSGTFIPQMAWIEYKMTEQASPELWKLAGNQPFITGHVGLSYSNYIRVKFVNKAISVNLEKFNSIDGNLDISDGYYTFESDQNFSNMLINTHLDKFNYSKKDFEDFFHAISINNLTISAKPNLETNKFGYELGLGHFSIHIETNQGDSSKGDIVIDNFKANGTYDQINNDLELQSTVDKLKFIPAYMNNSLELDKISFNQTKKLNEYDSVNGALKAHIESIIFNKQNLGSIIADLDFQNLDKKLFLSAENKFNDSKFANVYFSLNKFKWHTVDGDITLSSSIKLTDKAQTFFDIDELDTFKLNLEAPYKVLARIQAQTANSKKSNITSEEINKANLSLQIIIEMLLQQNKALTLNKGDQKGIYSDIDYTKEYGDEIKVNGELYSKKEFFSRF